MAFATTAMAVWLGPPGISLAVLVFTNLGNATSEATIGRDLLPTWAQAVSDVLPDRAATRLIQDIGYFEGSGARTSVAVLATWTLVSVDLVVLPHRSSEDRGRHLAAAGPTALAAAT